LVGKNKTIQDYFEGIFCCLHNAPYQNPLLIAANGQRVKGFLGYFWNSHAKIYAIYEE
jgi:hypothetical protein